MKAAIVGTDMTGSLLAEIFLQVGYEIVVYNQTITKTEVLVKKGASAAVAAHYRAKTVEMLLHLCYNFLNTNQ